MDSEDRIDCRLADAFERELPRFFPGTDIERADLHHLKPGRFASFVIENVQQSATEVHDAIFSIIAECGVLLYGSHNVVEVMPKKNPRSCRIDLCLQNGEDEDHQTIVFIATFNVDNGIGTLRICIGKVLQGNESDSQKSPEA